MWKSGYANLRLHNGEAPAWLIKRMTRLSEAIFSAMAEVYGSREILSRLSDPFFFQSCSNVLGFDWDSSGSTTVTCGILKEAFDRIDVGVRGIGGKGRRSKAVDEASKLRVLGLSEEQISRIMYASRISAKVDTAAVQAGYSLYHHSVFAEREGGWIVIQQGMRLKDSLARRFHWSSDFLRDFVVEPHKAIVGFRHNSALDMTAEKSEGSRRACVDLVREGAGRLRRLFDSIGRESQPSLERWLGLEDSVRLRGYSVPRRVNWRALEAVYMNPPVDFEGLLAYPGVGPATIRGLALIAQLLFGEEPSWVDPVKYSFAFGGKDGTPFPVDRRAMDEATEMLESAVESARLGEREKLDALARLGRTQTWTHDR
ncbi:MAG: DUF763 domain-containing protein [Candidatus Bathyarchaeia archaeon]